MESTDRLATDALPCVRTHVSNKPRRPACGAQCVSAVTPRLLVHTCARCPRARRPRKKESRRRRDNRGRTRKEHVLVATSEGEDEAV